MPKVSVILHDVPEDWPAADRHHWLWTIFRLLAEPRSLPTTEYDNFHRGFEFLEAVEWAIETGRNLVCWPEFPDFLSCSDLWRSPVSIEINERATAYGLTRHK